ncbi:MAG: hypothetical protein GY822_24470 [Deltaproteobacteria bacterium]|nr:hypothetical protein [Deltaproteobacteria bacterium]
MNLNLFRFFATCSALTFATGCIFVTERPASPQGDLSFLWSFDGEDRCTNAGVDEVVVKVENQSGSEVFNDTFTCTGGGLTIREFEAERHTVTLAAYSFDDEKLFEGSQSVTVESNLIVDMGTISLDRIVPDVVEGEVTLAWAFYYPSAALETGCARAGVDEVDVRLVPAAGNTTGQTFEQTYSCSDEGVAVTLSEGAYLLTLDAYKSGTPDDLHIYESNELEVVIISDNALALGDVEMFRVEESFGDVEVDWSLPETCATLAVATIDFIVTRVSTDAEELTFSVNCDAANVERVNIFVPGSYVIQGGATGDTEDFLGVKTFTVEPNVINEVTVDLVSVQNKS